MRTLLGERRVSGWSTLLAGALALLLLWLAFRGVNWAELWATVRQARPEVLALTLVTISGSYVLRGLRWRVLLTAEASIAPLTAFWANALGYLGNSLLPARAGEVVRTLVVGRLTGVSKSFVLATVLTERLLDVVVLVLTVLVALRTLPGTPAWLDGASTALAAVATVGLVGLFVAPHFAGLLTALIHRLPLPPRLRIRASELLGSFLLGMRAFQQPGRAGAFLGLTGIIWLADGFSATQVASALGLRLELAPALLLLAALGLASAAPSTPGYVGIYQFVAVSVLPAFGFSNAEALAQILVFQALTYLVVLGWGAPALLLLRAPIARAHALAHGGEAAAD